jgi:hypothetical protein
MAHTSFLHHLGKAYLTFPHENRLRPLLSYPLIRIAGFLPLLGRNTVAKVRPDRKPAVAWKPQRPFGGARVGKLSRGSIGPRTTTYVSMRLQKGEHHRRRGATRAERGWAHHPHTVARAERGVEINVTPLWRAMKHPSALLCLRKAYSIIYTYIWVGQIYTYIWVGQNCSLSPAYFAGPVRRVF